MTAQRAVPSAAIAVVLLLSALLSRAAAGEGPQAPPPAPPPSASGTVSYAPSAACADCHANTAAQHAASHHEGSYRNPLFQAQYFEELLLRAAADPKLVDEARGCTACHAPVAFVLRRAHLDAQLPDDPSLSGVTCDLCHTITGYAGPEPRNGNFVSRPSEVKLGPFRVETTWHRAYAEFQTRSELCATCHEAVNRHGVVVKGTYSEWKRSRFARDGVQCQDCHMTRDGFRVDEAPRYEEGKAASGALLDPPYRAKLYTHRFPGAHSRSQVEGALAVALGNVPPRVRRGEPFAFTVVVDNHRSGHQMPTGSADLRLLWLEVSARGGERTWEVPKPLKAVGAYGVAGGGENDAALLEGAIPEGARVYRAIFLDARGGQTLSSYDATRIIWDNRLEAGELRSEPYQTTVPPSAVGPIRLEARLVYLSYPAGLARHLGVPPAEPVEVARAAVEIPLSSEPSPAVVPKGGPPPDRE